MKGLLQRWKVRFQRFYNRSQLKIKVMFKYHCLPTEKNVLKYITKEVIEDWSMIVEEISGDQWYMKVRVRHGVKNDISK